MTFQWGREDCETSPYTDEEWTFPKATMGSQEMFDYFATNFSYSTQQTVALMGAHTLGSAKLLQSGYLGPWIDDSPRSFDNRFYEFLVTDDLTW